MFRAPRCHVQSRLSAVDVHHCRAVLSSGRESLVARNTLESRALHPFKCAFTMMIVNAHSIECRALDLEGAACNKTPYPLPPTQQYMQSLTTCCQLKRTQAPALLAARAPAHLPPKMQNEHAWHQPDGTSNCSSTSSSSSSSSTADWHTNQHTAHTSAAHPHRRCKPDYLRSAVVLGAI
jgi:hypothetical protein